MSTPTPCPEEHELLAVASGEEVTPEVQSHIGACTQCRQRLEQMRIEVSNLRAVLRYGELRSPEPVHQEAPSLAPPASIGKYHILNVLGRGGQADVYHALNTALGKEVVLKVSRRPLEPGGAERGPLLQEARLLTQLDHPCMARVYDVDVYEGHPYLVMEYVRGPTLRQHVEHQRLTPRQAATLVAGLARALDIAHRRGVVHQDLKPKNILIDETGQPRIIDFGMARLVHGWVDPRGQPEGGTVAYMAPEQARGEINRIDVRSDIFALGAVLYFLLVGRAPFGGRDRLEELQRAERCDFDREALHAAGVPPRLEAICLRAMAPDPAQRHARALDLAADLERFVRRPRQMAILACVVVAGLLAAPAWMVLQHQTNPVPDTRPVTQLAVELPREPLSLRLFRNGKPMPVNSAHDLKGLAPLRTDDELQIHVRVPKGLHASLFWIDSEGKLEELAHSAAGTIYFPSPTQYKQLIGPAGTEILLACWRRSGPVSLAELEQLWGEKKVLPALPATSVLHVDGEGVDGGERPELAQRSRDVDLKRLGPVMAPPDPEGMVRARLEQLAGKLRDRVDFLEGIAFAHEAGRSRP